MTNTDKHTFRIQYEDNTYQLVEWTNVQYSLVYENMVHGERFAVVDKDIFRLTDIRTIVYLPPMPEPKESEELDKDKEHLTEWGFVDAETAQWLRNQGIDISKGGSE